MRLFRIKDKKQRGILAVSSFINHWGACQAILILPLAHQTRNNAPKSNKSRDNIKSVTIRIKYHTWLHM